MYHGLLNPCVTLSKAFMKSMRTVSTGKTERKRVSMPLHTLLVIEWFMVCIFYTPLSHPFLIVSSRNWSFFRLLAFHGKALCCLYNFRYSLKNIWVSHNREFEIFHRFDRSSFSPSISLYWGAHTLEIFDQKWGYTGLLAITVCLLIICFFIFVLS